MIDLSERSLRSLLKSMDVLRPEDQAQYVARGYTKLVGDRNAVARAAFCALAYPLLLCRRAESNIQCDLDIEWESDNLTCFIEARYEGGSETILVAHVVRNAANEYALITSPSGGYSLSHG